MAYSATKEFIELLDTWVVDPTNQQEVEEWKELAQDALDAVEYSQKEKKILTRLLEMCEEQHRMRLLSAPEDTEIVSPARFFPRVN
jgi:hypothetical protein